MDRLDRTVRKYMYDHFAPEGFASSFPLSKRGSQCNDAREGGSTSPPPFRFHEKPYRGGVPDHPSELRPDDAGPSTLIDWNGQWVRTDTHDAAHPLGFGAWGGPPLVKEPGGGGLWQNLLPESRPRGGHDALWGRGRKINGGSPIPFM
jgi:hypothetical protein